MNQHLFMPKNHMDELYNSKNALVRWVHNNRLNNIAKSAFLIFSDLNDKNILDAGCGEGHLIKKLRDIHKNAAFCGIDITPVAIERAKKRCSFADIRLGDICETEYPDGFFDIIVCSEVLEHIYDFKSALKELERILKPEGTLIITFPNEIIWTVCRFFLARKPIKVPDHVNSFSPDSMKRIAKEFSGMKAVSARNLPFKLPFFVSLGCLMIFKKN